jgi:hypothetical protein
MRRDSDNERGGSGGQQLGNNSTEKEEGVHICIIASRKSLVWGCGDGDGDDVPTCMKRADLSSNYY